MECDGSAQRIEPRRSSRERRQVARSEITNPMKKKVNRNWSKSEKSKLLDGLKAIGDSDMTALQKFVPSKSVLQVAFYVKQLRAEASSINVDFNDKTISWVHRLKCIARNSDRIKFDPVPISLLMISLFEELPPPSMSGDVNFSRLYEYLFCEMAGIGRPELNKPSKRFLLESLVAAKDTVAKMKHDLMKELRNAQSPDEWPFSSPAINPTGFPKVILNIHKDSGM